MKAQLFLTFVIIPILSFSQISSFPKNDKGEVEYSEVIECTQTSDVMYKNAKEWIALTFGDYKTVIQFEDEKNYKLILKGVSKLTTFDNEAKSLGMTHKLTYTISFDFKDNKYRYRISDLIDEWKFLNTTNYTKLHDYNDDIEWHNSKLDSLNKIDVAPLKKKERDKISSDININKKLAEQFTNEYNERNNILLAIIESIKIAIPKNDNF